MRLSSLREMAPGTALNPEQASAVVQMMSRLGRVLQGAAGRFLESEGPNDFTAMLGALNLLGNLDPKRFGVLAEAGRTLGAMNDPLSGMNAFLDQFQSIFAKGAGRDTPRQFAQRIAALKTPEQLAELARQTVEASKRAKAGEVFLELWMNSLLSGPQTWTVNALSGGLQTAWAIPERFLAAGMGNIRAKESMHMLYGLRHGLADAFRHAWQSFKTGEVRFGQDVTKAELHRVTPAITAKGLGLQQGTTLARGVDFLGHHFVRFPQRMLLGTDEFFKWTNFRMELHAQAYRRAVGEGLEGRAMAQRITEIVSNPSARDIADVKDAAEKFALYQTFQTRLDAEGEAFESLGRLAQRIQEGKRDVPLLAVVVPFVRTPFNLARMAAERSPLGLLSTNVRRQLASNTPEGALARAKMASGTAVMGMIGLMAAEGSITGRGPLNPDVRKDMLDENWQPYSIRIGDKYIAYNRLDPIGMLFSMAADFSATVGEMSTVDAEKVAGAMVMAVWQGLSSKTYMKSLSEAIATISPPTWADPERSMAPGTRFFESFAGSLVPTIVATAERTIFDPTLREANGMLEQVMSRIPGWSATLKPRRNLFGEPIVLSGGLGIDMVSPLYTNSRKHDPVREELIRLRMGIDLPSRAYSPDDESEPIELNSEQYERLQLLSAGHGLKGRPKTLYNALKDTMKMSVYQDTTTADERRRQLIREVLFDPKTGYRPMAKRQLRREFPDLDAQFAEQERVRKMRKFVPGLEPDRPGLLPGLHENVPLRIQ